MIRMIENNMKYSYYMCYKKNQKFNVNYVREQAAKLGGKKLLVEVQSTKGITSDMITNLPNNVIIRVAGGYDEDRVNRCINYKFTNGETGKYYFDAVIYSKNELYHIISEIESIESGIKDNWSDLQKLVYIYDKLKTEITYDPKYEIKPSSEIRSLRGLITKKTVCAGYSLMLKELLDRQNIYCEYVEGKTGKDESHAWNIVMINGMKYPIDLTWDNCKFRAGHLKTFDTLGQDVHKFASKHKPNYWEKTQNYDYTLSQIDPKVIELIYSQISRTRDFKNTINIRKRNDGSMYAIAQVGDSVINGVNYYRYYFEEILPGNRRKSPLILYSDSNITGLFDLIKFGKDVPSTYEYLVDNVLFSRANIVDSTSRKGTSYIGRLRKSNDNEQLEFALSTEEIRKPAYINNMFKFQTRCFERRDGSVFVVQSTQSKPKIIKGIPVYTYDIFELVSQEKNVALKKNTVFTERNFLNDTREGIPNDYLSRDRLDRKANDSGCYIGYYGSNNRRIYNPELDSFFQTNKKIDLNHITQPYENMYSF